MSLAGVVPASGSSTRMGCAKALLRIGGSTFLSRVVRTLREAGCDPVYVVTASSEPAIAEEATRSGAVVLTNQEPGEGPITSLRLALSALDSTHDGVVYLPVDHPLVGPETVRELIEAAADSGARLALPMHGQKRGHPAVFRRSLFPELLDSNLEGGARVVVHRHLQEACLLETSDQGVITDIDTPEAYEAVVAALGRGDGQ